MRETLGYPPLLAPMPNVCGAVKMREVETIRRKYSLVIVISSSMNNQWLNKIPREKGYYLAGFVDGEGSFNVSLRRRQDHTMGWQVVLTFNISQKESYILSQCKRYLECGVIRQRQDGLYSYVVTNTIAIVTRVIPFFQKFIFLSQKKKRDFAIFCKIAQMVNDKQHITSEGLEKIIQLRESLNAGRGRKRKFTIVDWKKFIRENPQRLYAKPRAFRSEKHGDDIVRSV